MFIIIRICKSLEMTWQWEFDLFVAAHFRCLNANKFKHDLFHTHIYAIWSEMTSFCMRFRAVCLLCFQMVTKFSSFLNLLAKSRIKHVSVRTCLRGSKYCNKCLLLRSSRLVKSVSNTASHWRIIIHPHSTFCFKARSSSSISFHYKQQL